jgi:hypothetical protein
VLLKSCKLAARNGYNTLMKVVYQSWFDWHGTASWQLKLQTCPVIPQVGGTAPMFGCDADSSSIQ